jgi:hypothetical protein
LSTRDVGDRLNLRHLVYDSSGTLTDATVALSVTDPAGAVTTPSVTHTSLGTYDAAFTLTSAGPWAWKWTVSGTVVDVDYGEVYAGDPAPLLYASLSLLKLALGIESTDATRDDLLLQALSGASRSVEEYCDGRRFYLDATATARTFRTKGRVICQRDGSQRLSVDDIGSTTGLVVEVGDGTTWTAIAAADYETYPDNAIARRRAITAIVAPDSTTFSDNRRARITARWGWPAIPTQVEQASLMQAQRLYRRKDSPQGVMGSPDWGLVRVPNLDPDVKALLAFLTIPFKAA